MRAFTLQMSKIESGKTSLNLSPFSLSELVEELTAIFQPQAREKAQMLQMRVFGVEQERLLGDKLRLSEILTNLLSNAVKYTPEGRCVKLTVRGLPQTTQGYVHLLFLVEDNGIGMSPEFVQHMRSVLTCASGFALQKLKFTLDFVSRLAFVRVEKEIVCSGCSKIPCL